MSVSRQELEADCLRFFVTNRNTLETPEGLARRLAADAPEVHQTLANLSERGLLLARRGKDRAVYRYADGQKL